MGVCVIWGKVWKSYTYPPIPRIKIITNPPVAVESKVELREIDVVWTSELVDRHVSYYSASSTAAQVQQEVQECVV